MAITAVNISQDNIQDESNLVAVHSPLIFLVNADYTGAAPEVLYCDVYDSDDVLLGRFKCIPYVDLTSTLRQFMFIADSILRGFMESFDDEVQSGGSIEYVDNITKEFTLEFLDTTEAFTDTVDIVACHAVRQFGEDPNMETIFWNEAKTYYGYENKPVYVYIYNDNIGNIVGTTPGETGFEYALDYDDEIFTDAVDDPFTVTV